MSGEVALVDANVLVYAHYQQSEHHAASKALLTSAEAGQVALCVTSQVLAEFYSVITNPRRVSPPFEPDEAVAALDHVLALPGISILPLPSDVPKRWIELARDRALRGKRVFDLQLIATMQASAIRRIYTYNLGDFSGFVGIEAIRP